MMHVVRKEHEGDIKKPVTISTSESKPEVIKLNAEQPTLEDQKVTIEKLIKDPKVREHALVTARDIEKYMRGNWWTIEQLNKKSPYKNYQQALDLLNLLCLIGVVYQAVREKGIVKYKVTLSNEDRLKLLSEELSDAEFNVERIKKEMEAIIA